MEMMKKKKYRTQIARVNVLMQMIIFFGCQPNSACIYCVFSVTFESIVDVVRGSHVTTVGGGRFCGADDNVGGLGNVLVTGRQTQANIFGY